MFSSRVIMLRPKIVVLASGLFLTALFVTFRIIGDEGDSLENGQKHIKTFEKEENLAAELKSALNVVVHPEELKDEEKSVGELNKNVFVEGINPNWCTRRPKPYELLFSNTYWQVLKIDKANEPTTNVFIYNSYLDTRSKLPIIHLLVVSDRYFKTLKGITTPSPPTHCQFWYKDGTQMETVPVSAIESVFRWFSVGVKSSYHPFLISCELPSSTAQNIESVSLVDDECSLATNDVKLVYDLPKDGVKKDFGVCFKWIDFPNAANFPGRRLIEMIELLKIMGVSGAHFPILYSNDEIDKVLNYYEEEGFVRTKPITLPGFQLQTKMNGHSYIRRNNETKIRQELIPYVDCFLSNLYRYKYIGILDLDEVVLPTHYENYADLFKSLELKFGRRKKLPITFCFDMKLFIDKMLFPNNTLLAEVKDQPEFDEDDPFFTKKLYYDKPVFCGANHARNFKCYHNTENVLIVSNHRPTLCLGKKKTGCHENVNISTAYTHHHKNQERNCVYNSTNTDEEIDSPFGYDNNILRFKKEVVKRRNKVMNSL